MASESGVGAAVRECPEAAALPIGPAVVAMLTGIAGGFVIAGGLGLLKGLV